MVFNGLKGAELIAFNYLRASDLSRRISLSEIADATCYAYATICRAAQNLESYGLIERYRERIGQAYTWEVKE